MSRIECSFKKKIEIWNITNIKEECILSCTECSFKKKIEKFIP
ncbi:MAG: hypothetical protein ACTSPD_18585 [Promethearchaeota archaeon]